MTSGYSEQQPLLASYATDGDPESARVDPEQLSSHQLSTRWRARTAEILELPRLHKAIIALVRRCAPQDGMWPDVRDERLP